MYYFIVKKYTYKQIDFINLRLEEEDSYMQLDYNQASAELFTNNYNVWKVANPPANKANAPTAANSITKTIFNSLAKQWDPGNPHPNSHSQRNLANSFQTKEGIRRWVTASDSARGTVDFHAYWHNGVNPYRFLWHFRLGD